MPITKTLFQQRRCAERPQRSRGTRQRPSLGKKSVSLCIARQPRFPYLGGMDLHLNNPELQAKLDRWVTETGRAPDELVEDAMAGYFDELARTREMLNRRYDDLKSGKVKPIDGEEFFKNLRQREDKLFKKHSPQ